MGVNLGVFSTATWKNSMLSDQSKIDKMNSAMHSIILLPALSDYHWAVLKTYFLSSFEWLLKTGLTISL